MKLEKRGIVVILLLLMMSLHLTAQEIMGTVVDAKSKEPLIGATIEIEGKKPMGVTDFNGHFKLSGLQELSYTLVIRYVAYQPKTVRGIKVGTTDLMVEMNADEQTLKEVQITAAVKQTTETAMVQLAKESPYVMSNISSQEIRRTQDSNAGEVIRRVPGVSLIEDKFVMVRGLSQRYNNVWVNGGAVPSSEADSRAFSFDIVPSSQIDNLLIVKTQSPEYPSDYSGGFIVLNTKEIPSENSFSLSLGGNWNTQSAFQDFTYAKGSNTDFLGFDGGLRSLNGGIHSQLKTLSDQAISLLDNGLNNDWHEKTKKPLGDLKLSANWNHQWDVNRYRLGMIVVLNYSNEYRTYRDMENNLFGIYDAQNDRENYLRQSVDNQFNNNVRLGSMFNLTLMSKNGKNKYQLKNIFNQLGNNRYTERNGISAQSNNEQSAEYYYRSRTTYNAQLTGKHTFRAHELDWNVGYAYANRHIPDRRRYLVNDAIETNRLGLLTGNDVSREWTQLDEHIVSGSVNDKITFNWGQWEPFLKYGAYGEYRTRDYTTRELIYNWNTSNNNMPDGFRYMEMPTLLSDASYFGVDKLHLLEQMHMRNDYIGHNTLGAGYLAMSLPFGKLGIYAGVRFEHNNMELVSNTRDTEVSHVSTFYKTNDLFPSLNTTYKFNDQHQLRLSYGRSINRPEFREVSSSVYYDFDLASDVKGNPNLKNAYVDNIDLRYEYYPSRGEQISVAAFYKHFKHPIEWTYTVTGGTDLNYSYINALAANNYGLELDIKKTLDFIGLPHFSWSLNGALIKSNVQFEKGSKEKDRPMQGQSPYLINTGIFYKNEAQQMHIALLYNRIGKRIIGVGRSEGTTSGDNINARVPDSYEMPRDVIDFTASKKFGNHWELKLGVRDLLAQKVYYKQFADVTYADGAKKEVTEISRCYQPGRNLSLSVIYQF